MCLVVGASGLDNAPMESFWGTLKQELVYHRYYRSRRKAIHLYLLVPVVRAQVQSECKQDITEYIEIFYNRQRQQARLGYLAPAAYEQKFYVGLLAA